MSSPKVHLEIGPFGKAACGKANVDTTKVPNQVTCRTCRKTYGFTDARLEKAGVVGQP